MAKFSQDFRVDCILVHAQKNDMLPYASQYLKMTSKDIGERLMWLKRQPDKYKKRIEASATLMDMKVQAKKVAYE